MMPRFDEIDGARILVDRAEAGLRAGDEGVVVWGSEDEETVAVEFLLPANHWVLEDFRGDEVRVTWSNARPVGDAAEGTTAAGAE